MVQNLLRSELKTILPVLCVYLLSEVASHGRLIEPPSRASAWRYGFDTPHNYNDHESYCGGFTRQWVRNEGKCGVCGDPWDAKAPRAHEYGGTYGQAIIVRKYPLGGTINIRVELTANHFGHFEFALCPNYKNATQKCLDRNILHLVRPQEGVEHQNGARYYPKDGNRVYEMKYRLPKQKCEHCLLQWRYKAGNNWGNCPNGTGAVGCGPQEEFRACADIAIDGKAGDGDLEEATVAPPIDNEVDTGGEVGAEPAVGYNPISAIVLSLVSFLVVFLILFLLYFHFYQVGRQVKGWLAAGERGKEVPVRPPLPPPRTKRQKSFCDGLHDVDLRTESMA